MKKNPLVYFLIFSLSSIASAQVPDVQAIAKKIVDREDGKTSYTKVTLLTCGFDPSQAKKKCKNKPRRKTFESLAKDIGPKGKDTRGLSIVLTPASETGVGFLQEDYDDDAKDTQQWIFLPAMKKLKRIVSESSNSPKTGSFFGSVIAYEDMEKIHLSDYHYRFIKEDQIDGRKAWVLETKPTPKRAPKTSYGRNQLWVDQESFIILKGESYSRSGELLKTTRNLKLEKLDGIWLARQMVVISHKDHRMSLLKTQAARYNMSIDADLLAVRALNDSRYRETALKRIRQGAH